MIDYKALAGRIKEVADAFAYSGVADALHSRTADLRTVVSLLEGMAEAEPDGEVVAGTGSLNDMAMIRWCSDYRPKIGDRIYARPAPQPQPTEAQIEDGVDAVPSFIGENYSLDTLRFLVREVLRAALAAKDER